VVGCRAGAKACVIAQLTCIRCGNAMKCGKSVKPASEAPSAVARLWWSLRAGAEACLSAQRRHGSQSGVQQSVQQSVKPASKAPCPVLQPGSAWLKPASSRGCRVGDMHMPRIDLCRSSTAPLPLS